MRLPPVIFTALIVAFSAQTSRADVGCLPDDNFDSVEFSGEVYGDHPFRMNAGFRQLRLEPMEAGWHIRVYRADGSAVPVRAPSPGIPSPDMTQISGQDFSSFDTMSSMPGAVIRKFVFGRNAVDPPVNPELLVPQLPSGASVNRATVEPTAGELGIGELIVEDIGLADLGKNQRPRLTYLKFSGCLGWHRGYQGPDWRMGADPGVSGETISAMKQCGFDDKTYELSDHTTGWGERGSRASLDPDLMSEGVRDIVAPVRRRADDQTGLGICFRSENHLTMAGFEDDSDVGDFMGSGDYWYVNKAPIKPGSEFPRPAGDGVTIGIRRGPSLFVFMDAAGSVQTRRQSPD